MPEALAISRHDASSAIATKPLREIRSCIGTERRQTPCVRLELECVAVGAIALTSTHRSQHGYHHVTHYSSRHYCSGRWRLVRPWTLVLRKTGGRRRSTPYGRSHAKRNHRTRPEQRQSLWKHAVIHSLLSHSIVVPDRRIERFLGGSGRAGRRPFP